MKFGVSTLGRPKWTLEQNLKAGRACGCAGIEWRGLGPELDPAHPRVGALGDLHRPYRRAEAPERAWAALGPFVRRVHIADSRPDRRYCLLGGGDVPGRAVLDLLAREGCGGWVTVEWEKRWHLDIADPDVAFPRYARVLQPWWTERAA